MNRACGAGQYLNTRGGEMALGEDAQQLLADDAHADNGNVVLSHGQSYSFGWI
jgi:hypothetical protein